MRTSKTQLQPSLPNAATGVSLGHGLRVVVALRAVEILSEVTLTLRRLRTLLLVVTISVPLFMAGLVAALWHLAH